MTQEQAKHAKLAKGFALEPVIPGSLDSPVVLGEKRERKKADIFGYEDQQKAREAASSKPKEKKTKVKPTTKAAAVHGNGTAAKLVSSAVQPVLVNAGLLPHEDKRPLLRERLKKIEARLQTIKAPGIAGAGMLYRGSSFPGMPQQVASALPLHMQAAAQEAPMAGNKRRASEFGGDMGMVKKPKSSGSSSKAGGKLGQKADVIMSSLMENPASKAYFNRPVDPIADGVPDYPSIVTEPMDLGTIKKKISSSRYASHEQWANDVRKVWENAMSFNAPGNDVHESAKNLAAQFEAYYLKHYKTASAGTPSAARPVASRNSGSPAPVRANSPAPASSSSAVEKMARQMELMQQQLDSVKAAKAGGGGNGTKKKAVGGGGGAVRRNMTFEEKRTLSLNINRLSTDKLAKVVEIIKKKKKVDESEEIEIDIDSLGETTLRELEKYVNSCLNPVKKVGNLQQAAQAVVQSTQSAAKRPPSDSESSSSESSSESSDSDDGDDPAAGAAKRKPPPKMDDDGDFHGGDSSDSDGVRRKKKSGGPKKPAVAGKPSSKPAPDSRPGGGKVGGGKGLFGGGNKPPAVPAAAGGTPAASGTKAAASASSAVAVVAAPVSVPNSSEMEPEPVQEPTQKPQILPTAPVKKPVEIQNTADWGASLMDEDDEDDVSDKQPAGTGVVANTLWSQFQVSFPSLSPPSLLLFTFEKCTSRTNSTQFGRQKTSFRNSARRKRRKRRSGKSRKGPRGSRLQRRRPLMMPE